jgi:hypothetical protein
LKLNKIKPKHEDEGVGARAVRLIPGEVGHLDPFVLFDDYQVFKDSFFPEHPHSGFEGFQVLMEGRTLYEDNDGRKGSIDPWDVRRFVAGNGFRHSERPEYQGTVRGYLLWIKVPKQLSDTASIFREERKEDIPIRMEAGKKIRIIIGKGSPVETFTPVRWEIVESMEDEIIHSISKGENENGFVYIAEGEVASEDEVISKGEGGIIEGSGKIDLRMKKGTQMAVICGKKLHEPIIQNGHLVQW